ncbi:DUF1127 domain-containing protein [Rhodospirillaceae bacterium SYSU D60014]|uniref:DUF1127 domain-containing protein n=1 Tax=Virgifigura deserti TaxID=2268457 RepID=UPI000E671636
MTCTIPPSPARHRPERLKRSLLSAHDLWRRLRERVARGIGRIEISLRRRRNRADAIRWLMRLDDRMLRDVGLTREDALELNRSWRSGRWQPTRRCRTRDDAS